MIFVEGMHSNNVVAARTIHEHDIRTIQSHSNEEEYKCLGKIVLITRVLVVAVFEVLYC